MRQNQGFTLLEIVCVMALFLVVILLVGSLFILAQQTYRKGASQSELVQNARVCLDRMGREFRQASYVITDITSSTTPANEIFFQDGHDPSVITYIRYYLNGTDLMREHSAFYFITDPSAFVYYNSVNVFGNPPAQVVLEDRIIGEFVAGMGFYGLSGVVEMRLDLAKQSDAITMGTKVYIRNW